MLYTLAAPLPKHRYVYVDTAFTHREPAGYMKAVWFGLVSYPGRMWGCNLLLENGAIYRNIPLHGLAFSDDPDPWSPKDAQTWDCYGYGVAVLEYPYLSGLECLVRTNGQERVGEYLFTAVPVGDGFSAAPEQAKEFTFIRTEGDRVAAAPTNDTVFLERSFTGTNLAFPKGLKRQVDTWSCEDAEGRHTS